MKKMMIFLMILCVLLGMASCRRHTHKEVFTPYVQPTCSQPGYTEGSYCATCDKVLVARTEIPAYGHNIKVDEAVYATSFATGLTEGSHCLTCGEVLVQQQVTPIVPPAQVSYEIGTITTEKTVIKTDYVELHVPANVYIPENLAENMDAVMAIMEEVSGLSFSGRVSNREGRVVVKVQKSDDPHAENEPGGGCGDDGVHIAAMDLIQYNDLVRVYGDVLEYNTSRWFWSYFSQGGLRAYITYKTRAYVEENCPQRLILTGSPDESFLAHSVYDYNALYRYPVEHWLENTFTEAANIDSSIGFRFMWYLEEVYGDYTRWLTEYEKSKPSPRYFSTLSVSKEIQAYKKAYGDDVFDGFYPWLKERESFFDDVNSRQSMALTNVEIIRPFPRCIFQDTLWNVNCTAGGIVDLRYNNMWVDIETGRQYLNVYKGLGTDGMILSLDCSTAVELYDSEGRLVRTEGPAEEGHALYIEMDGISFLKLVGDGTLRDFWMYDLARTPS